MAVRESAAHKPDCRVILLVHRQETMSFLGFPVLRYIDINDAEEVIRAIQLTDEEVPIDLVLHTPGGLVLASLQIARAVRARKGKVTVFVPHYAMSGGTLIALAADEIVMDSHAVLGPVDPQLGEYPAASLIKVVQTVVLRRSGGGGRAAGGRAVLAVVRRALQSAPDSAAGDRFGAGVAHYREGAGAGARLPSGTARPGKRLEVGS